jgi:uncharacterized protein YcfL
MKLHSVCSTILASAVFIMAGCQTPVTSGQYSKIHVSGDQIIQASLQTDNLALSRHVSVVGVNTKLLSNGLLKAEASIGSTDHRDYSIYYKFYWYDNDGMEMKVGDGEPWMFKQLHGGEFVTVTSVAPFKGAASLKVAIRSR